MSKKRRKNSDKIRNIILVILFILLLVIIFIAINQNKDKDDIQNNNVKNQIEENNINKKEDKTTNPDETNNSNNASNDVNSEPKQEEKSETKQEIQNNITVNLELNGSEEITINVGDKYKELGAKAIDSTGKDVSSQINIDSNVDTSKKGEYMVIYSIGKSMAIRTVIVK